MTGSLSLHRQAKVDQWMARRVLEDPSSVRGNEQRRDCRQMCLFPKGSSQMPTKVRYGTIPTQVIPAGRLARDLPKAAPLAWE